MVTIYIKKDSDINVLIDMLHKSYYQVLIENDGELISDYYCLRLSHLDFDEEILGVEQEE